MSITERLQFIITATGADAAKEFRSLGNTAQSEMAKVEGATGKGSAALGFLKENAAQLAVAGGAAIVAFGVKSVGMFQDIALAAGKFSDQTRISTEDASRWIEVAGDLGIEADTVSGAMLKMEKAAGTNAGTFRKLGVDIAYAKDGTVNANETFIRAIERLQAIKDPTERAAAGAQLFGKSWANMAEIVESKDLRAQLGAVSNAKVIDASEVEKAREFRAAMDGLQDAVQDVALAVGESLVPALTKAAKTVEENKAIIGTAFDGLATAASIGLDALNPIDNTMAGLNRLFDDSSSVVEKAAGGFEALGGILPGVGEGISALNGWLFDNEDSANAAANAIETQASRLTALAQTYPDATAAAEAMAEAEEDAKRATDELRKSYELLIGKLDTQQGFNDLEKTLADLEKSGRDAFAAAASGAEDAGEQAREFYEDSLEAQEQLLRFLQGLGDVPVETATEIQALIDEGAFAEAERRLRLLEVTRTVTINVQTGKTSASSYLDPRYSTPGVLPPGLDFSGFNPQGVIVDGGGGLGGGTNRLIKGRSSNVIPITSAPSLIEASGGPYASDLFSQVERASNASLNNTTAQSQARKLLDGLAETEVAYMRGEVTAQEWSDAQLSAYRSAQQAARSAAELAQAQAALEGKTLSAKETAQLQRDELDKFTYGLADGSPLRKNLAEYIALLDRVKSGQEGSAEATKKVAERQDKRIQASLEQARVDLAAGRATQGVADATNDLVGALFSRAKTQEEAAARADAIARAEQSLVDSILAEADALAEQQRVAAAGRGTTLSEAEIASLKLTTIQAEASKLMSGNARSALDSYASTLQQAVSISLNVSAQDPFAGQAIFDALDREFRRRGLGGLGQAA